MVIIIKYFNIKNLESFSNHLKEQSVVGALERDCGTNKKAKLMSKQRLDIS